jgi:hypothetical protein
MVFVPPAATSQDLSLESYCLVSMHHPLYLSLIHGGLTALMHVMQFLQIFDTLNFTLMTFGGIISLRFAYSMQGKHITPISSINSYNFIQMIKSCCHYKQSTLFTIWSTKTVMHFNYLGISIQLIRLHIYIIGSHYCKEIKTKMHV